MRAYKTIVSPSTEMLKAITGYDGKYAVDDSGYVINAKTGRVLKQSSTKKGYQKVDLYLGGERKTVRIHRLVAEAFILNPDNKPQVNHIDNNKLNNAVSNLEWVTDSENKEHYRIFRRKG